MVQVIEDKRDENLHSMQQIHTILSGCFGRTKEAMPKVSPSDEALAQTHSMFNA